MRSIFAVFSTAAPLAALSFLCIGIASGAASVGTMVDIRSGLFPFGLANVGTPGCMGGTSVGPGYLTQSESLSCSAQSGSMMFSGTGRAAVELGVLHAFADAETTSGNPALSGLDSVTATAFISDTLFIPGRPGDFGMLDFRFFVDGSFGISLARGIADRNHVMSSLDLSAAVCSISSPCTFGLPRGSHFTRTFPDQRPLNDGVFDASGPAILPTLLVPLGVSSNLVIELDLLAEVGTLGDFNSPDYQGRIAGNFEQTVRLTGVDLFDLNGNPLSVNGLTSESGFDYTTGAQATPEPGTLGPIGALGLAWLVRKGTLQMRSH